MNMFEKWPLVLLIGVAATASVSGCSDTDAAPDQPAVTKLSNDVHTNPHAPQDDAKVDLAATVTYQTADRNSYHVNAFQIQNNNDFEWRNVTLKLVARCNTTTLASETFDYHVSSLAAHSSVSAPMNKFIGEETSEHFKSERFVDPELRPRYFQAGGAGLVSFEIDVPGAGDSERSWSTIGNQDSDIPAS